MTDREPLGTTVPPSASPATTKTASRKPQEGGLKRFGNFLIWLFTGFGLLRFKTSKGRYKVDEIVVYSVHRAFYLWLLIVTGFIAGAVLHHFEPHRAVDADSIARFRSMSIVWGWVYVVVLLYTFISLLFDMSFVKFIISAVVFGFIWLLAKFMEDRNLPVLSWIGAYLVSMKPELSAGFAKMMSVLLMFPWLGALFHSYSRGRKCFSPNSIEEYYFGEGTEITDRSGLKFRMRYRDLLETMLGLGAADLEAVDNQQHVVKRFENILFLSFIWPRLDEILHQRSVGVDNAASDPVEVEIKNR